jgi:hypothetical protein
MNSRRHRELILAKRYAWEPEERIAEPAFDDAEVTTQELPVSQEQPHEQKDPQ